jgi:CubicO group peptidase (beta-lactamase class C family)
MQERIFGPLGMTDTGWWAPPETRDRLAALYAANPAAGGTVRYDSLGERALSRPELVAGGSGLVSSAQDYHRFTQMLLNEGTYDGVKLLGSRTVRYMTRNHLPGNQDLAALYSGGGFSETIFDGIGFGLGFAVVMDPTAGKVPTSEGSYYWGGMASTAFWVDPREELTALLFTQLVPSSTYSLRPQLRQLVYSALA